jgi:TldD protein
MSEPFRPFETHLDDAAALKLLREATDGAEDGELFLERRRSEALVFDDGRVKTASYDAAEGFGLRAVKGDVAGYAHSTEISEAALRRAGETARLAVGDGGGTLADGPAGTNAKLYTDADPMAGATFAVKLDTLREIDAFARALDPRVVQVSASLAASTRRCSSCARTARWCPTSGPWCGSMSASSWKRTAAARAAAPAAAGGSG